MPRWVRTRVIPLLVWLATMAGAALLWVDLRAGGAVGFVPDAALTVAPQRAGRVATLEVEVGQRVRAGHVIATLDAREIDAELEILAAERRKIEAQLGAVRSETELRQSETVRELEESVESAELALKTARAAREAKSAALKALSSRLAALRDLVEQRMADRRQLDEVAVEHSALQGEVVTADMLIAQLVGQVASTRARRGMLPGDAAVMATEPMRAELTILERRAQLLELRRAEMVLRAPTDGQVAAIQARPGEVVDAGTPVVTLVGDAPGPARVLVCLTEEQAGHVRLGEVARLYPRGAQGVALAGHVVALGPAVAELPIRCRRDPQVPVWGREVAVALDDPARVLPGQAFSVAFTGELDVREDMTEKSVAEELVPAATVPAPAPAPAASPARAPAVAEPTAIAVPAELAARTRVEPSGLAWVDRLGRFVVVSDDTGHEDRDEHAPWLLTMDARGRLDPEPLAIVGLQEVSDLEAIAPGPEGSLYVLASQSRSRKGKRSKARQVFARVVLDGEQARAAGVVHLASLLDAAAPAVRAGLGLAGTEQLDIEGMTATVAGGLLLGLKAPLTADGAALVWHLPRPERLLAGEGLAAAGLTRWGSVRLTVTADGASVPGGVSELLELADGSLLIAATKSGADPAQQSGSLWHVAGKAGLAAPRLVRVFAGLKPEGISSDSSGKIAVVFDTGDNAPLWTEVPWPAP